MSKLLGSPPFISNGKAMWKGSHNPILRGLNWDDPRSIYLHDYHKNQPFMDR